MSKCILTEVGGREETLNTEILVCSSPECEIECPERLTAALDGLRQRGLQQRCLCLTACEASEEELGLVHRSDNDWAGDPTSVPSVLPWCGLKGIRGVLGGCCHQESQLPFLCIPLVACLLT